MTNRIIMRKLLFYHHLANLPDESLAKEVFNVQAKLSLPGLVSECYRFLAEMNIAENPNKTSKWQWKRIIKTKIMNKNRNDLLNLIKGYKKLSYDDLSQEHFERKSYLATLNPSDARLKFKIESQMVPGIKMNFKNNQKYKQELYKCDHCPALDSQDHLRWCQSYAHLREGKDLSIDADLVAFFKGVMMMREV